MVAPIRNKNRPGCIFQLDRSGSNASGAVLAVRHLFLPGTPLAPPVGMQTLFNLIAGSLIAVGAACLVIRVLRGEIMATREQFSAAIDTVNAVLDTIRTETSALVQQVQELQDDLANQDIPDELMTKLQSVVDKANEIDGLVPATPVVPTPEQPTPANPTPEVPPPTEA